MLEMAAGLRKSCVIGAPSDLRSTTSVKSPAPTAHTVTRQPL
jgi:hypothetical protein